MSEEDVNKRIRANITRFLKMLSKARSVHTNIEPTKLTVSILFTEKNMNEGASFAKTIEMWMQKTKAREEDIAKAKQFDSEIQGMLRKLKEEDNEEE